jgi:PAS domain S-box-containing protein
VPGTLAPFRRSFGPSLRHGLIHQTASFILVFRVLEGLAAWILFSELFLSGVSNGWPVQCMLISYFAANVTLWLCYRAGRITTAIVLADAVINLGTMILAAGYTGGLASPVVLIVLLKIAGYAFVFGPAAGVLAAALALVGFAGLGAGEQLEWWRPVVLANFVEAVTAQRIEFGFRLAVLSMILAGAIWLLNQIADKEREVGLQAKRAAGAAEREHSAATMTAALLSVSEAASRLTRLDDILHNVVDIAPRVLAVDYCGIFLWNGETGTYQAAAVSGVEAAVADRLTSRPLAPAEVPDLEWVRRLGHCAVTGPHGLAEIGMPQVPAVLSAPLLSGGRFLGILQFARRHGQDGFTQRDLRMADGIAGQTAVALERARLLEESRRLARAVESTSEAVLITDRHRHIVFANEAFLALFGYPREDILGRDSLTLAGDIAGEWLREIERSVLEQSWRGEAMARRKDGSTFPVSLHVNLIRGDDNEIQGSVSIMEDISAQKLLQEQLQRTDRVAAAGELAAGLAHEVNNALAAILGQVELSRDADDVATLQQSLTLVETQGRRIGEIVQQLLGFARPQPPERSAVDLHSLVRDTLALMAHDLNRSGIRSEIHCAADVPPVLADGKQIQQVLVNLFTNALQAIQPGVGSLVVSIRPGPGAVSLEVQDSGSGIAAEHVPRVFDPFFSTKATGTGLGLSVSYAIVRAHSGDLTVRSELGVGTTFTVQLPAAVPAAAAAPRTVLLVDDDPAVAETLSDMLSREGLSVQRAATGGEALAVLATETFDAIFLDVRLPDISGPEVYAQLSATRPELARRVIFVTGGLWRIESRGLREKLPAQPTLSKPCTAAQIRQVLGVLRDARAAA